MAIVYTHTSKRSDAQRTSAMEESFTDVTMISGDDVTDGTPSLSVTPVTNRAGQLTYTSIFQILLASVAVLSNLMFLIVASVESKLRRRVTYIFLRHISLANLLLGLLIVGVRAANMVGARDGWKMTGYVCSGMLALAIMSSGCAVMGLLLIAIHMLLVMLNIHKKQVPVTSTLAWILIVGCWLFWTGIGIAGMFIQPDPGEPFRPPVCFFGSGYHNGIFTTLACVLLLGTYLVTVGVQAAVPFILKKNTDTFQKEQSAHQNEPSNGMQMSSTAAQGTDGGVAVSGRALPQTQNIMIKRRLEATRSMLILSLMLLILYTISWCPYLTMLFLFMVCPGSCGFSFSVPVNASATLSISAALSVFALTAKDKEFRQAISKIFCRGKTAAVGPETSGGASGTQATRVM